MPDIRIEDTRKDGGALTIYVETALPYSLAALLAAIRQALKEAGVK